DLMSCSTLSFLTLRRPPNSPLFPYTTLFRSMMDDYTFNNAKALPVLVEQGAILKRFPDAVLQALRETSEVVLNEVAAQSDLNTRIHASQTAFLEKVRASMTLTERELYNWR